MKENSDDNEKDLVNDNSLSKLQSNIAKLKTIISIFEADKPEGLHDKEKFFEEYILLEDLILNHLEVFKKKGLITDEIELLVEEFTKFWNEYQDSWDNEYWELYEFKRSMVEYTENPSNFCENLVSEETLNSPSSHFFELDQKRKPSFKSSSDSNSTCINSYAPSSPKSVTLNKIDDEISQIKDTNAKPEKKKNRTCDHCIAF